MGLFDRLGRLVRANLNALVANAEDPEKVLAQTLDRLQDDLLHVRQAAAQAVALQKRTERQRDQARQRAQEGYAQAQAAIDAGNEDLARAALIRRLPHQRMAVDLDQQLLAQSGTVAQLRENMLLLEHKLAEARAKRDLYLARARSAQASQRMHEMLGQVQGGLFDRVEERTIALEAAAEATALGAVSSPWTALEAATSIEEELERLKARRLPGNSSH